MTFNQKLTLGISLLLFFQTFPLPGQEKDMIRSFTLQESVEYALQNAPVFENATIDEQIAKAQVGELRAAGLPQVSGTLQLSHNDPLRRMFFGTSGNNPILGDNPDLAQLPDGSVIALQNFFQLPSGGDAGVTINQLIFSGSYFVGLKAAKTYRELASKTTRQTKIQTVEQVTKAYYLVLINQERLILFEENVARVDSLLRDTKGLFKSGFAESIEVDRVQVALNNLILEKEKFENLLAVSLELLKFQMNYPMDQKILLSEDVKELEIDTSFNELIANEVDYANRIEYSILQTQENLQKLDLKNIRTGYLPTLSAFANLGYFTQSPDIRGIFSTQTKGLPETFEIGPDKWYNYGLFGLNLSLPIFDGLSKTYQIQQSKLNLLKIENYEEVMRSRIALEVNQSKNNLKTSLKAVDAHKKNMELAEKVARITKVKYTTGVGSNFEVTEAETALREAQTNYYSALYDAIIAQIDLQKALGTLVN